MAAAKVHKVNPQLQKLMVPIDSIFQDPKNARLHGERNIDTIRASLDRFGQRKPLVVQADGRIVRAGNGTLRAAQALGWTHVAVVLVDEADVEATAYALTDNRSAELAEWDWVVLEESLAALAAEVPMGELDALGWSADDFDALVLTKQWEDTTPPPAGAAGGGDRAALEGTPIKFTPDERKAVDEAMVRLRAGGTPYPTDGAAVAAICRAYIKGAAGA